MNWQKVRWVSIRTSPKKEGVYLVCVFDFEIDEVKLCFAYWSKTFNEFRLKGRVQVTHWMKIPNIPDMGDIP